MTDKTDTPRTDALADFIRYKLSFVAPEALIERLDEHLTQMCEHARTLKRDLSAARAECERLRKDAERYQWITSMWPNEITRLVHSHYSYGPTSTNIHRAIDAAIAREAREQCSSPIKS